MTALRPPLMLMVGQAEIDPMPIHIGLLRAINVAGRNKIGMGELRDLLLGLGMSDAKSLLQSGNLLFRSRLRRTAQLERLLEEAAERQLGLQADFLVRSIGDWRAIISNNPFRKESRRDPSHLIVMFLKAVPEKTMLTTLQKAIVGHETVRAGGQQLYIVYPDGIGRSRLTHKLIEKTLGMRGTGRNWNTVLKLNALAKEL